MKGRSRRQQEAWRRLELILAVRSGELTVTDAARVLGISRKSYYQWENRGLAAMLAALENQDPGRPAQPGDPEKEQMHRRIRDLRQENHLLKQTLEIRALLGRLGPNRAAAGTVRGKKGGGKPKGRPPPKR